MEDSDTELAPTEHAAQPQELRDVKNCPDCGQRFGSDARFCPFDGTALDPGFYDPSGDPLIGKLVDGRYEVEAVLGEGGMGTVYRVRHAALDRPFAMKVLRSDLARDAELAQRFTTEARATAAVRHPNIVSISDFGVLDDGTPYFVMELLIGRTLSEVIKAGGAIPPGRVVRVLRQIASALGAAHAAGVIHRDLKPENVFLVGSSVRDPLGDVRIVDFGAARILGTSRITKAGIVFGTPHYMSPEQATGGEVDHRTDIYSLGIIMYEVFTGRVPFEADSYMGVLTQHLYLKPHPPTQAYPAVAPELGALEEITLRALEKKPQDRYASMQEVLDDLDAVAKVASDGRVAIAALLDRTTHGESARGVDGDESLRPPMQGSLLRWIAGGAALGALIVFGAVFVIRARARASAVTTAVVSTLSSQPTSGMPPAPAPPAIEPKQVLLSATPGTNQDLAVDAGAGVDKPIVLKPAVKKAPAAARALPTPMDDIGDPFKRK